MGTFVNDKKQGNGKLKYKSKEDVYIGEFKNNTITGVGKYIWKNKDVYEELLNILYNNKEMLKFFLCEDIDDDNPDKSLMTLIQVHFS